MARDPELQRRRQMVIRDILRNSEEPPKDQQEIVEKLKELGIPATQPSVSRDLKEIGAVRSRSGYSIPSWAERADESPFRRVLPLIRSIRLAGPYQMLMLTTALPHVDDYAPKGRSPIASGKILGCARRASSIPLITSRICVAVVA